MRLHWLTHRLFPATLLIVSLLPALYSSDDTALVLVPRDVYIADRAEARFFVSSPDDISALDIPYTLSPVELTSLNESCEGISIEAVELVPVDAKVMVRIQFIPWQNGLITIAPFTAQKLIISPPAIPVASLLERTGEQGLLPARHPLLLPGTTYLLYGIILLLLICSVCIFLIYRWCVDHVLPGRSNRRLAVLRKRFLRDIRKLEKRMQKLDRSSWFDAYSTIVRIYLAGEAGLDVSLAHTHTAREFSLVFSGGSKGYAVGALLEALDYARFSGTTADERQSFIGRARDLCTLCSVEEVQGVL